nr:unnamed protein product [Naegleria fowleri]
MVQTSLYDYANKKKASSSSNGTRTTRGGNGTSLPSAVGKSSSSRDKSSKRKKNLESDDDEEFEYREEEEEEDGMDEEEEYDEDEEERPKKTKKGSASKKKRSKKSVSDDDHDDNEYEMNGGVITSKYSSVDKKSKNKNDERFEFLVNRMDAQKRLPSDPDFDKSTLFISSTDFAKLSSFEKQYWEIKKNHMDKVVMFKKGKFYELYEEDADVGKKEFDWKMTERVNMRMVGIPEQSFKTYAAKLINLGYTVVRVEQVETANEQKERKKQKKGTKGTSTDCVKREICEITTLSTITDLDYFPDSTSKYLLCIKEDMMNHRYGVTFVDVSMDIFYLGYLEDDNHRTQISTLIYSINPSEIILERQQFSPSTKKIISNQKTVVIEKRVSTDIVPKDYNSYPTAEAARYFVEQHADSLVKDPIIEKFWDNDLVISSFGACVYYLKYLYKDDVLSSNTAKFFSYDGKVDKDHLILDGQTLLNLDVKISSTKGTREGSLLSFLDHTKTAMGKRLLENWLTRPSRNADVINDRYNAIEDIQDSFPDPDGVREKLAGIKDLERMCSFLYRESRKVKKEVFFDNRASKKKIKTYLETLDNLRKGLDIIQSLQDSIENFKSNILQHSLDLTAIDEIDAALAEFENEFDRELALTGEIKPNAGYGKEYEEMQAQIESIHKEVDTFLADVKKKYDPKSKLDSKSGSKDWFIVIPRTVTDLPEEFVRQPRKLKEFFKYKHSLLTTSLEKVKVLEDKMGDIQRNIFRTILGRFSEFDQYWKRVVQCLAKLDCILSLHSVSIGGGFCRPVILQTDKPVLKVMQMKHPTVKTAADTDFIPNDIILGGDDACSIVVTGPNMGGKSTILRSACIAVIMAQIGCFVPAESCELTLVDRIFTRIGANDRIMAGESTFMVELNETSNIIRHATPSSLVILDELGRGTSTHDGYALARSILEYVADVVGCLCLFSTHYFELTEEMRYHPNIDFYKMTCEVQKDENGRILDVIFTYHFKKGVCEKSYGIQVAKKAGVPIEIIDRASIVAEDFEQGMRANKPISYDQINDAQRDIYESLRATSEELASGGAESLTPELFQQFVQNLKEKQIEVRKAYSNYSNLM